MWYLAQRPETRNSSCRGFSFGHLEVVDMAARSTRFKIAKVLLSKCTSTFQFHFSGPTLSLLNNFNFFEENFQSKYFSQHFKILSNENFLPDLQELPKDLL